LLVNGRPPEIFALYAVAAAAAIAWVLVPLTERLAQRIKAIDVPNERSLHQVPTPKLGGLAMLVGVLVAGVLFLPWAPVTRAILGGAVLIAAVGLADDVFDLPPGVKLVGQIVAAMIPVFNGVNVVDFTFPFLGGVNLTHVLFHDVPVLGNVTVGKVLTVVGFVAVMNIINFIDGVDGLAAGVCVISAATLSIIALSLDRPGAAVLAALTGGAALGFLRHGFPPASSFMGDTGSNLLGYLLAAVAVVGSLKTNAVVALFFPLCVLAVPILDSGFVIAKRIKHRRPIYMADRSHFHHRMANIGFSQRRTLAYLYGWALVLAGLALALRFVPYSDNHGHFDAVWTAVIVACGVAAVAASVYLLLALEILKLRLSRFRELVGLGVPVSAPEEVDAGVATELETGTFPAVDPETGEFAAVEKAATGGSAKNERHTASESGPAGVEETPGPHGKPL
jgi:UDP-GlcNAc:undecaprenyl-phosphate/decaprenyl-phosphate GlcNAc-1-phosphate transferase